MSVLVAGAGMAGLVAATRLRELGADVELHEKGDRPGGNMRISSGVVWRHRELERFREECPGGDPGLQRLIWERLDDAIGWLEARGAAVVGRETGNPLTVGTRFDPARLIEALARDVRLGAPVLELPADRPVILATGGFAASLPGVFHRCTPWSTGDGLRLGLAAGGRESPGMDEVFGRAMPAPPAQIGEGDFVALAQLYARHAEVVGSDGARYAARTWSENDVTQWLAAHGGGTFVVARERLGETTPYGTVADAVAAAESAGGPVRRFEDRVEVDVVAGVSTTLGGLAVDTSARVADGVFAAGNDAGGWATGGYASGLAAALVLGLVAAENAVG